LSFLSIGRGEKNYKAFLSLDIMKHVLKNGKTEVLEGGDTQETFLLTFEGKKFVLRKCPNKKRADELVFISKKLKKYDILPKLYYQDGRSLIFEYIEGRDCKRTDALKVAKQVGRICALANTLQTEKQFNLDKRISKYLNTLKKNTTFSDEEINTMESLYFDLKKKIKFKIVLDANDIYPENFRLRKGKVYLVDVDAIKPLIKGYGIGKGFLRWFRTQTQRNRFLEGYSSRLSVKYLSKDYLKFLYLNFFLRSGANKLEFGKNLNERDVQRMKLLVK